MATKFDMVGVEEYLNYMQSNHKRTESFAELEKRFGMTPYSDPGNRAKKLWRRFVKSNLSIQDFMNDRFGHYSGDGTDGMEILESSIPIGVQEFTTSNGGTNAYYSAPTDRLITNKDEAVQASGVDLNEWKLKDWKYRTWNTTGREKREIGKDEKGQPIMETYLVTKTNYGIQLWFVLKDKTEDEVIRGIIEQVDLAIKNIKVNKVPGKRGIGVVNLADFHIGANVKNLLKTPDFNMEIFVRYMNSAAEIINSYEYKEIYINMLGDYFESISGHNHMSTFKSLEIDGWGSHVIIAAAKILADFLSKVNNVVEVNMISGNHDRMSADSKEDNDGSGAHILYELLKGKCPGVKFNYHSYLLARTIDNVVYILTHGHHKMNSKDTAHMVLMHGNQDLFNVWLCGHIHTRKSEKAWVRHAYHIDKELHVAVEEYNYRKETVRSIFTGNQYSEMLGYTTKPGFLIMENNGKGDVISTDVIL